MHQEVSSFVGAEVEKHTKAKARHHYVTPSCAVGDKRIISLLEQLRNVGLWPRRSTGRALNCLLTVMEVSSFRDPSDLVECAAEVDCLMHDFNLQDYNRLFTQRASEIRQSVEELKLCKPRP